MKGYEMATKEMLNFGLNGLIESKEFIQFLNLVHSLTGIRIALMSSDGSSVKNFLSNNDYNPLCQLIQENPNGLAMCLKCDSDSSMRAAKRHHGMHYLCHAGLVDFIVPIYFASKHVASINCGQILNEPPSEKGFEKITHKVKSLGLDLRKLRKAYFDSIYMSSEKIEHVLELLSFFADYFCEINYRLHIAQLSREPKAIQDAVHFIEKNYTDSNLTYETVAEYVGLSPEYFSRLFKKSKSITYTNFLTALRISHAKKLLDETNMSIAQIAYAVGYNSQAYFDTVFKKFEKCTPYSYRAGKQSRNTGQFN